MFAKKKERKQIKNVDKVINENLIINDQSLSLQ